ncbi:MAG: DUF554 domain-containing protein [Spirochaetaceae bacterium]|nr:DUF554 domain-containing protein [Spirochaetaceae bacterium]
MIATIINAVAIILGSLFGILLKKKLNARYEATVFTATGIIALVIGIQMALKATHVLAFALALIIGGLVGTLLDIEGGFLRIGERLKKRFAAKDEGSTFAYGFLDASVLFCAGAMAIVGSFKAGTEGDYSLLLTKSVMDGFISVLFASAMGVGVAFSALSVLVYQGLLTILSVWVAPFVSETMLAELTGVGGALVIMIGINLLGLKKLKTADFIPGLLVTILLVLAFPYVPFL